MTKKTEPIWISKDYSKCSGCRKCEIACSLFHEQRIWPEASRVRVFMLVPGAEVPHMCVQCEDYPCVKACPVEALSISEKTNAVLVNREKCIACGKCIDACLGKVPHIHPAENYAVICDLCDGDPQCVKVCREGEWNALKVVPRENGLCKLFSRTPEEITKELAENMYGKAAEKVL